MHKKGFMDTPLSQTVTFFQIVLATLVIGGRYTSQRMNNIM